MKEKIKEVLDKTNIKASNEIMILEYIDDLQERIDKAIKYIQDYKHEYYYDLVDKKEILNILRDKPEYLGYSDKECINCGRLRVEKYSDGTEICEKCNFDQNKKEYVLRGKDNNESKNDN